MVINLWQHNIHATQKFTYDQNNQATTFTVTWAKHYFKKTRMAFNRAHTSAKDADIANLFNKRPVTHSPMRSARVSLNVTVTLAWQNPDYHQNLNVSFVAHVPPFTEFCANW